MRKNSIILLIVFCLLLPVYTQEADVLEGFTDYAAMLRMMFGHEPAAVDFVSDTTANSFLRLSIISLSPILKADKAVFWDTTVYFKSVYALDTTIWGIFGIEWIHADTNQPIDYVPRSEWKRRAKHEGKQIQLRKGVTPFERRPYYYDHIDDTLFLFPTPIIGGDSLRITAWRKVLSISASDNLDQIPQKFRAPIVHYAAWLIARSQQHPLTELYRLGFNESLQMALGASIKVPESETAP